MAEYIDREQAIETFKKVLPITPRSCGKTDIYMRWISVLSEAWNDIPSVDVRENIRGEWIPIIDGNEYGEAIQVGCYCSECGEELQYEPNFCPNCGADMREKQ